MFHLAHRVNAKGMEIFDSIYKCGDSRSHENFPFLDKPADLTTRDLRAQVRFIARSPGLTLSRRLGSHAGSPRLGHSSGVLLASSLPLSPAITGAPLVQPRAPSPGFLPN